MYSGKLAYSLHLAVKNDSGYQALYDNCGLMYAKAEIAANGKLNPKNLKNPYVFYMKDGQYGIISVRTDSAKQKLQIRKTLQVRARRCYAQRMILSIMRNRDLLTLEYPNMYQM